MFREPNNLKRSQNVIRTFPANVTYSEPIGNVLLERSGNLINQKRSQNVIRTFPANVTYSEPIGNVTGTFPVCWEHPLVLQIHEIG